MNQKRSVHPILRHACVLATAALTAGAFAQQLIAPSILPGSIGRLSTSEPAQGNLNEASGQNFKDGSRMQLWSFTGTTGEQVSITVSSNDFDTFLTIFSPTGELVDWNDDDWNEASDYWYSSSLDLYLQETGRYLAVVSGYSSFDMGTYEIVLGGIGPKQVERDFGAAIPLAVPGQASGFVESGMPLAGEGFSGPSQTYTFSLDRPYMTAITARSEVIDTLIILYDSNGVLINLNDDDWSGIYPDADTANWTDSALTVLLPAGEYYLVVGAYSDWEPTGPFDVNIRTFVEAP